MAFRDALKQRKNYDAAVFQELLGDPTVKYTGKKLSNATPYIESFSFSASGDMGKSHMIEIKAKDDDNEEVFFDVEGIPDGSNTWVDDNTFYWKIRTSDLDKTYKLKITAYNKDSPGNKINSFTEECVVKTPTLYEAESVEESDIVNGFFNGDYVLILKNESITFRDIYAEQEGNYTIKIKYSNRFNNTGKMTVIDSNGQETTQSISFDSSVKEKEVTVHLKQGNNSIKFSCCDEEEELPAFGDIRIIPK